MQPFLYLRPREIAEAVNGKTEGGGNLPATEAPRQFIAGGTNLTDYMKLGVARPRTLVDVNGLAPAELSEIHISDKGLRLGALVRMAQAEDHPDIRRDYPVIHDTLKLAASRQLRNMASLGGNLLQRTRCEYFRDVSWPCNKRNPGSGCSAMDGVNRRHAILGVSDQCIATYPGDFALALCVLGATLGVVGPQGVRTLDFLSLHTPPGQRPNFETVLEPNELIAFITVPAGPWARRSRYVKVRDRESYEFAVTSAAVALHMDGETVRDVRIALGGVATTPWRAFPAEAMLTGRRLDEAAALAAAGAAFEGAVTRERNAFKVRLGVQTVVRALFEAKAMEM